MGKSPENVRTEESADASVMIPQVGGLAQPKPGGWKFNLALFSVCLAGFTATLDGSIIATALPKITVEIGSERPNDYVWIANCFLLAQTVVQPPLAQICNIFGRRNPMLVSLAFFAIGSGIAGGSNTADMLIAGRTIQGAGSGGIMLLIEIIVCDLVPMRERGKYLGIVLSVCSIGAILGPLVGGALVQSNWRWIFYLNLPVAGAVLLTMAVSLQLRYEKDATWKHSLARIDFVGSALFVSSICAILVGLIMGGMEASWTSWRIIMPLVLGLFGWILFHFYEMSRYCKEPSIPPVLFQNRTSIAGFLLALVSSIILNWVAFFLPLYFQSVKQIDPLKSGIDTLPFQAFLISSAMIAGFVLTKTGSYKPLHLVGFALIIISFGLFTMLDSRTHIALWVIYQAISATGFGCIIPSLLPAIQASLDESEVASSVGVFSFLRSFGFTWGVTIPGIVFSNYWEKAASRISNPDVRTQLSRGMALRFASNMYQHPFDTTTRDEIVSVYVATLRIVWIAAIPFAAVAFCLTFVEKNLKLREELDTKFGLDQAHQGRDETIQA